MRNENDYKTVIWCCYYGFPNLSKWFDHFIESHINEIGSVNFKCNQYRCPEQYMFLHEYCIHMQEAHMKIKYACTFKCNSNRYSYPNITKCLFLGDDLEEFQEHECFVFYSSSPLFD